MSELCKIPMVVVGTPEVIYKRLTGVISKHMHHRSFIFEDQETQIVIWTTLIVKSRNSIGHSYCYCGSRKEALKKATDEAYQLWMEHNYPPHFPAKMYDFDLSTMYDEEILQFLLRFEHFDITDQRGEKNG